jgi:hypothetical protein
MPRLPFTTKPEDIITLLNLLPTLNVPAQKVGVVYIKALGFSQSSANHLTEILVKLGFVDSRNKPSSLWRQYTQSEDRGLVLASAIKRAYSDVFAKVFCPYLEPDDDLLDYFRPQGEKISTRDLNLMLETFRALCELADFQNEMGVEETAPKVLSTDNDLASVEINPNLQLNIQIHIDPNTADEKIETIFKNMRKYLLGGQPEDEN